MTDWKVYGKSLSSYSDKEAIEWLQGCVENLEAENQRLREAAEWDVVNALSELDVRTSELAEAREEVKRLRDAIEQIVQTASDCESPLFRLVHVDWLYKAQQALGVGDE